MNGQYKIFNNCDESVLSFNGLVECYDYTGMKDKCSYTFMDVNELNINLNKNGYYSLKCDLFDGRLDFDFYLNDFYVCNGNLVVDVNISSGMYEFGALSTLEFSLNDNKRIWLDMRGCAKKKYISASYLKNGFQKKIKNEVIVIEGKYIHDYYSFYCELGYSIFGNYGYIGSNLNAVYDILNDTIEKKINLIWKDSFISFKAIDNTVPEDYYQSSSEDILVLLNDYFNIILE
ncbi:TPA: barstar family protein [Proteus mirabilis]|nr:barstar family protein [Proteus mirabilis]